MAKKSSKKKEAEVKKATVFGKTEIVDAVYTTLEGKVTKKAIGLVLSAEKEVIKATVSQGDAVRYIGFGSFASSHRNERSGRNPQTGEEITIPAHRAPTFSPSKDYKDAVK